MEVIAIRSFSVDGVAYKVGDVVPGLSPEKVAQLVAQRWLRQKDEKAREYTVLRPLTIGGKSFTRGQRVRVSKLSPIKLAQFLENRILEPVAPQVSG